MESKQVSLFVTVVMLVLAFDCGHCDTQKIRKVVSIRSNAVIRLEDSESVLHRDSRSVHRSERSPEEAIYSHNRARRMEMGSDMELMIWNNILESMAKEWATNCQWRHGQLNPTPSSLPYSVLGQNLYAISGTSQFNVTAAILQWYDEKPYYNYDTTACQPGAPLGCGHYTQTVWSGSRELGCAVKNCSTLSQSNFTSSALFLVCNYGPAGNVEGQKPYKTGTACSQCATGSFWCNNGLCDPCNPICQHNGSVNNATCTCSCAPGWHGSDCSLMDSGGNNYSTSTKASLLSMLAIWSSSLLLYSFGSI